MRILIVSHEYPPIGGGGANACRFLGDGFSKKSHEVCIVTAGWDIPASQRGVQVEVLRGNEASSEGRLELHRLKCARKHKEHCSFFEMSDFVNKALGYCGRLCASRAFDVCLIFFGIPSGVVGRYLYSRFKLPYVIRFGGGDIPGFQERFKAVYSFLGPFVKDIWKHSSALVANSSGLKSFAQRFCDKYPISVVPNGVDVDFYGFADRTEAGPGEVRLLFVSRLIERKGLQFLIPRLKDIKASSGKEISLTVVGDGPYRQVLESLALEHGVGDMISFEGQKDKEEISPYFGRADIFVFPSKREGMPNAVLEAMAGGLAVVMTNCEGASELIDGNGIIAASQEDFYKSVIDVIAGGKIKEMGAESKRRAREIFSWEETSRKYLEIFGSCIRKL